jgi:hypothetical protein
MILTGTKEEISNSGVNVTPIISHSNPPRQVAANCSKKNSTISISKKPNLEQKYAQNVSPYLHIEIIQKIINKFLIEKKMSKEELAMALEVSIDKLEGLLNNTYLSLIPKINLPLIKLYCETKFDD